MRDNLRMAVKNWNRPPVLSITDLREKVKEGLDRLKVDKVYIFGSYANGTATKLGDIDFIIVSDQVPEQFVLRAQSFLKDFRRTFSRYIFDVLVYTQKEWEEMKRKVFYLRARKRGIVKIYP